MPGAVGGGGLCVEVMPTHSEGLPGESWKEP